MNEIAEDFTVEYDECMSVTAVILPISPDFAFKKLHKIFIIFIERI